MFRKLITTRHNRSNGTMIDAPTMVTEYSLESALDSSIHDMATFFAEGVG